MAIFIKSKGNIPELTITYGKKPQTKLECYFDYPKKNITAIPFCYAIENFGMKPKSYKFKPIRNKIKIGHEGRDYQKKLYSQIKSDLLKYHYSYAALHCGAGKTVIASKLLCELNGKGAILCHLVTLFDQWYNFLTENTDARVVKVQSHTEELPDADIYIFMQSCVRKFSPGKLSKIKFLVIDEALYYMTDLMIKSILKFQPTYLLSLCAQIKRKNGCHKALPIIFGQKIIRKISDKYFKVFRINTPFKPKVEKHRFTNKLNWTKVITSLSENYKRICVITALILNRPKSRFIVGFKYKRGANLLFQMLVKQKQSVSKYIGKAKTYKPCRILIATYKKCGIGFDEENLKVLAENQKKFDCAIMADDILDPEQFVGRAFRTKKCPKIFDIVDDFSTLRKHFDERSKWYMERNCDIDEKWLGQM